MKEITYDDALRALNEAVKAKGYNHVYEREGQFAGCYNVTLHGEPGCIVGHALVWLGVPAEWFLERDENGDSRRGSSARPVCSMLRRGGLLNVTDEALELFAEAQTRQDSGVTWGEAVTKAHLGTATFEDLRLHHSVPA